MTAFRAYLLSMFFLMLAAVAILVEPMLTPAGPPFRHFFPVTFTLGGIGVAFGVYMFVLILIEDFKDRP